MYSQQPCFIAGERAFGSNKGIFSRRICLCRHYLVLKLCPWDSTLGATVKTNPPEPEPSQKNSTYTTPEALPGGEGSH